MNALPWLLASDEPAARWIALTALLGLPDDAPEVRAAHEAVVHAPGTQALLDRLPDWEDPPPVSGHDSPGYAPNLLNLLADMGVQEADDQRIGLILDRMAAHCDASGRFAACLGSKRIPGVEWTALLCDAHAIAEVLLRFGRRDDPRVIAALARMEEDLAETAQGLAWPCRPDPASGFRGPGRKNDLCPQVTLEALRAFSHLPEARTMGDRPAWLLEVIGASLGVWLARGEHQPYMFGHGRRFKRAKWPLNWYNAVTLLDAVGRWPLAWLPPGAPPQNTRAVAEIAACVIAYNLDPVTGRCTPRSCFKGFEAFSFGQKKAPSAFATARILAVLARVAPLQDVIARTDVLALGSSKGGSGVALAP